MTPGTAAGERPGSFALGALVFGAGIGALATEITASRLLAPYFGSSTLVWANLIGIVLAALALGYWLGGRLADRRPEPRLLGGIVLVGGGVRRGDPVRGEAVPGLHRRGARHRVGGRGRGELPRRPAAVRAAGGAPRDGLSVRDPARGRVDRDSRGRRRQALRALDCGIAARHVPARARPHPRDRHAADVPRRRGRAGCVVVLPARRALPRRDRAPRDAAARPAGRDQGRGGPDPRGDVDVPVHRRRPTTRREACAPSERGRCDPLAVVAVLRAHGRRVGHVPRHPAAPRPSARAGRDSRQRGRDHGACARCLLPRCGDRRRRARPGGQPRGDALLRDGGEPAADGARRRRAPVPPLDRRRATT